VPWHAVTFQAGTPNFWSYCVSYCNVISDLLGCAGTVSKKKKALER
jgi:hypothetical protein